MFTSTRPYRYIQELFYVIAIIGILAVLAISSYLPAKARARVISITGVFSVARTDSQVYYAINGEWPEDISREVMQKFDNSYYRLGDEYNIEAENGAVSFTFEGTEEILKGKKITLRPVIQNDDPFGPVHWVCGDKGGEPGWKISGVDKTNIDAWYIPGTLK